jgi:hypothetical protein
MTAWNIVNLMFAFFSAYMAMACFEAGVPFWGWFNLFASASNAASLVARI